MSGTEQLIILYVPCGSEEEAAHIALELISEGLIACGNVHASRSLYRWQDKIADETEFVLWAKTTRARAEAAARRIQELHSYEIPCILTISPEAVNSSYEKWVAGEVSGLRAPEMPGTTVGTG